MNAAVAIQPEQKIAESAMLPVEQAKPASVVPIKPTEITIEPSQEGAKAVTPAGQFTIIINNKDDKATKSLFSRIAEYCNLKTFVGAIVIAGGSVWLIQGPEGLKNVAAFITHKLLTTTGMAGSAVVSGIGEAAYKQTRAIAPAAMDIIAGKANNIVQEVPGAAVALANTQNPGLRALVWFGGAWVVVSKIIPFATMVKNNPIPFTAAAVGYAAPYIAPAIQQVTYGQLAGVLANVVLFIGLKGWNLYR